MEDGDSGGDNHSDRDSDKFGNGIVHEVETKKTAGFSSDGRFSQ